ncbi:MAG: CoA-acylating methylmalonate-semialdehyde dehydrogenase [Pararhodobacter sp.]|nr:CoA-acylating methylmalonate-semialdehyde dehydrogenase [Pararhodobacter sp.]
MENVKHFINGHPDAGFGKRHGPVYNPSTGEVLYQCLYGDAKTLDRAISVATEAGLSWGAASHAKRLEVTYRFRELIRENTDRMARLISIEHGKTIPDAKGEILRGLEAVEFATNAPHLTKGEYSRNVGGDIDVFTVREPVGVVGCIAPFNFPVMVPLMMATMAIACGNAVILKPSEKVPGSAILLGELWKEAGLPDGIWNVVNGDKEMVDGILDHPGIAAVSFVGSTPVGEYIYHRGTANNKRVACFTGGKNHMVVMPDADLESAANAFVSAGYGSASQRCMAISLLLPVGDETAERLLELIKPKIENMLVGPYNDPKADFGAVISGESKAAILRAIDVAEQEGATVVLDGRKLTVSGHEKGFYIGPTLLDRVTTKMEFYQKEVFGPARGIVRTASLEEAIAITNAHEFGNGAVIYTRNGEVARRFGMKVEAGMIGVNVPVPVPAGYFNFGGLRRSKFGESHLFGPDAARFYTKSKTISQRWPEPSEQSQYSMNFPSNS